MNKLISRQAAIDALETVGYDFSESELSEVELEEVCGTVSDVKQDMIGRIKQLPYAEPKKGKWLYQIGMLKCDQCLRAIRRIDHDGLLNFCPNCGADMREERDGEI